MACLDNLIGVSSARNSTTSVSGRYVNELPYISIETAEAIVTQEDKSGYDLLQAKIKQAQNEMIHEVRGYLMPRMRLSSVIQNDRAGTYPTVRELVSKTAGVQKGLKIDINISQYLSFYINSLTLWLDSSETVTIYLYDRLTGQTLDTFSITTTANAPTSIFVGKGYVTGTNYARLALVMETTGNAYKTQAYKGFAGCRECSMKPGNKYAYFYGTQVGASAQKIDANFTSTDNTFGLSVDYSLNCDAEPFVCNMRGLLAQPLLYKAAELIMREVKVSDRLNSIVLLHDEDVNHLIDYYHNQYRKSITQIFDTMALPQDLCNALPV